jgi:hypothetical protein
MGFKKNQISARNPSVLAFGFTEKRQLAPKTDRNSVFFVCEAHIPYQLYIMVHYTSFYGF